MKQIIIITLLFTQIGYSQSLTDLIKQYEKECSQIVNDTIEQDGTVDYSLIPVYDQNKNIVHYALGKPDTTWSKPDCNTYKYGYNYVYYGVDTVSSYFGNSIIINTTNYPIYKSEKQEKTKVKITRQYVCQVKERKVEPFSDHFWNWVKKQNK